MSPRILIKGAGEHASGTAHRLFRCGCRVAMTELPEPRAVRRAVSFCSALYDGQITVEGVQGVAYDGEENDFLHKFDWTHIPIFADARCELRKHWKPDVIIDARIAKQNIDNSIQDAALTIGYGPGLVAGRDVHVVIETNRGHNLGRIITHGAASPDTKTPGPIGGYTIERVLRSPADGRLAAIKEIGEMTSPGDLIATVSGREVRAQIAGVLRGLIRPGSKVEAGLKIGDIDPRGDASFCYTVSDKARTLSGSALEVVCSFFKRARAAGGDRS